MLNLQNKFYKKEYGLGQGGPGGPGAHGGNMGGGKSGGGGNGRGRGKHGDSPGKLGGKLGSNNTGSGRGGRNPGAGKSSGPIGRANARRGNVGKGIHGDSPGKMGGRIGTNNTGSGPGGRNPGVSEEGFFSNALDSLKSIFSPNTPEEDEAAAIAAYHKSNIEAITDPLSKEEQENYDAAQAITGKYAAAPLAAAAMVQGAYLGAGRLGVGLLTGGVTSGKAIGAALRGGPSHGQSPGALGGRVGSNNTGSGVGGTYGAAHGQSPGVGGKGRDNSVQSVSGGAAHGQSPGRGGKGRDNSVGIGITGGVSASANPGAGSANAPESDGYTGYDGADDGGFDYGSASVGLGAGAAAAVSSGLGAGTIGAATARGLAEHGQSPGVLGGQADAGTHGGFRGGPGIGGKSAGYGQNSRGGNPTPPGFSSPTLQPGVGTDPYGDRLYRATHERNKLRRNPTGVGGDLKAEKAAGELGLPQNTVNTQGVIQELLRSTGARGSVLGGIIQAQAGAPGGGFAEPGNPGSPGAVGNTGAIQTNTQAALRNLLNERERRGLYRTDRNLQNVNLSPFAPGRQRLF